MLKKYIALISLLISSSFIFSLPLFPDISDWEKEIKRLDCVESLEIEKQYPNYDESVDYDMKIFLTDNRFLQIKYFNPHKRRKEFVEKLNACQNCKARYLLHGTLINAISHILTDEFKFEFCFCFCIIGLFLVLFLFISLVMPLNINFFLS